MRRREFITLLGGAGTWPLAAHAQEPGRTYRIGFLIPSPRNRPPVAALFDELRLNGFIENQNVEVLPGGFDVPNRQLAELAATLVKAAPDAIVAGPELPLRALQTATRTVPLIGMSEDLVAEGLVASLARPGGNITGISLLSPELDGKRQDILIEAVPGARRIAAMVDSKVAPPYHLQMLQHGARSRGVELSIFGVKGPEESYLRLTLPKPRAPRRLISWPHRSSLSPVIATIRLSWTASRQYVFRQYSSGPKRQKLASSWHTAHVLQMSIVSAREFW